LVPKAGFNLEIVGLVDPYNWILKIGSVVSYKTNWIVLGGRVCVRVESTLIVWSVARCKYPFRIHSSLLLKKSFIKQDHGFISRNTGINKNVETVGREKEKQTIKGEEKSF
jgi:hypothetical protein